VIRIKVPAQGRTVHAGAEQMTADPQVSVEQTLFCLCCHSNNDSKETHRQITE